MIKWNRFKEISKTYGAILETGEKSVTLTSSKSGMKVSVSEEEYFTDEFKFVKDMEYDVAFFTQHRYFDKLADAANYVRRIMDDDVIAVQFYNAWDEPVFGGDIDKNAFDKLTSTYLSHLFGIQEEIVSQYSVDTRSWSGDRDLKKKELRFMPR